MVVQDEENELRRFLHWGPITMLMITSTVTLTTCKWWPPDLSFSTSAHFGLFMLLNLLAIYNYCMAILVGPGVLPKKWKPQHYREVKVMQYCKICEGYKAPRAHHCRQCNRCVKKMDHHCPWTNCCVGWNNHAYFVYFIFFYILSNLHAAVVLWCAGKRFINGTYFRSHLRYPVDLKALLRLHFSSIVMGVFSFSLAVGIVLCLLKLFSMNMWGILKNRTDIECLILHKAKVRRQLKKKRPFVFPYDLGWYANLGQVFNMESQLRSKGIDWPLRPGCDKYALTCEQIAQKIEKRKRTRLYKCIREVTGYWLPILSQGLWVSICMPWSSAPRIALQPNDLIRVTGFCKHWLYGERVINNDSDGDRRKGPIRGWFPSFCAIDITKNAKEMKMKCNIKKDQGDITAEMLTTKSSASVQKFD